NCRLNASDILRDCCCCRPAGASSFSRKRKYDVIIGKGILRVTTIEENKTNHCSRAAWRVDFYGLASNTSTILFVVSASMLISRFLQFPTVDGCNATQLIAFPTPTIFLSINNSRGRCQTQSLAKRRGTTSLTTTDYSPKIFFKVEERIFVWFTEGGEEPTTEREMPAGRPDGYWTSICHGARRLQNRSNGIRGIHLHVNSTPPFHSGPPSHT
ncbi:hypothetical protein L9F63_010751, partial [Diploptera punctata]